MGKLDGKVAIITGGSGGFGEATAHLWAKEGANVVIADILVEEGGKVVKAIEDSGGDAIFVKTDITKAVEAENMVKTAVNTYGRLDILFNNAGILGPMGTKAADLSVADAEKLLAVNVMGVFLGTKYAIPTMLKSGGGVILTTGSDSAFYGNKGIPIYCATKGAVLAFSRVVAADYARQGIRSNTVSPCVGRTPMHKKFREENMATWKAIEDTIPMGRACEPEDIAYAALFLVSDDAKFITGANLMVDGGFTISGI